MIAITIKDNQGQDLEVGALYVCGFHDLGISDDQGPSYGELVRYVGIVEGRHTFADADTWEEHRPDFDFLLKQSAPVIDPVSQGW